MHWLIVRTMPDSYLDGTFAIELTMRLPAYVPEAVCETRHDAVVGTAQGSIGAKTQTRGEHSRWRIAFACMESHAQHVGSWRGSRTEMKDTARQSRRVGERLEGEGIFEPPAVYARDRPHAAGDCAVSDPTIAIKFLSTA